jgi:hypothetical protein
MGITIEDTTAQEKSNERSVTRVGKGNGSQGGLGRLRGARREGWSGKGSQAKVNDTRGGKEKKRPPGRAEGNTRQGGTEKGSQARETV